MAAQSYDQAYADLGSTYDPQVQLLQQQQAQAQTDSQAQQTALDQAKVNAFRDITNSANAKGMLFSGFSPDQQATYIGTKYLPAVANLKSTLANTINTSNQNIAKLYGQRQQDARQTVAAQVQAEQAAADRQQAEADRQAQLGLGYARLQASQANRGGISPSLLYQMQKDAQNAGNNFLTYIDGQFKRSGGAGNTGITRQAQDAWANNWFAQHQVSDPKARQMYWDLFNTSYNRSANPLNDPRYKR